MGETVSGAPRFVRPNFRAAVARTSAEPVEVRVTERWVSGGELQRMQLRAAWRRRPARMLLQGLLLLALVVVAVVALRV